MQYITFKDDVKLSRLGMGAMRLPVRITEQGGCIDIEAAQKLIDHAMENGINYYDTAYVYHSGQSEAFLGKALSRYPRDSYYLADKYHIGSDPDCKRQFEKQLERLGVEYIDFYLLHGVRDFTADRFLKEGYITYFDGLKKAGKIRYFGFSFHGSPDCLRKMLPAYDWDFVQLQLNPFDWEYADAKELYREVSRAGLPIMVMEPLRGGLLTSGMEASLAFRWLMELQQVAVVLSGMSEIGQMEENIRIFSDTAALEGSDHTTLKTACEALKKSIAVPCTNCRYCCGDCPKKLNIPQFLFLYNKVQTEGVQAAKALGSYPADRQPEHCIQCGKCVENCPQDLDIPAYLGELAELDRSRK